MKKSIHIFTTLLLLTFVLRGQNKADIYEIKIDKYSIKTIDQDYFELKKTFTVNVPMPQYIRRGVSVDANETRNHPLTQQMALY